VQTFLETVEETSDPAPFAEAVQRAYTARGWTKTRFISEAGDYNTPGASPEMIRMALNGRRRLTPTIMEAAARALDVPPEAWIEYRLARARRLLDEQELGLEAAAENYMLIEDSFADLLNVDTRLAESDDQLAEQVAGLLRERRARVLAAQQTADQGSTGAAAPPPQAARSGRAPRRPVRRPA
jgi:transcriptional regulator with XRE-family HTH domain